MKTYSIRDLTQEFGVTARTIRHYEEIGLLHPARRGQTRVYTPADRTRLKLILRGKRLGFSLEESREIVDMYDPDHGNQEQLRRLIEAIRQRRTRLKAQMREIEAMLAQLDEVEEGCVASLEQAQKRPGSTTHRNTRISR